MNHNISISHAFSEAWKLFKNKKRFLILAALVSGVIMGIVQFLTVRLEDSTIGTFIITIVSIIIGIAISLAWANTTIKVVRGNSQEWEDVKTPYQNWWKFFIAQLLYAIPLVLVFFLGIILVGISQGALPILIAVIVLAIAVSIYVTIRFMFLALVAIENPNLDPVKLLKKSAKITKGHFLDLIGFHVVAFFLNLLGLLCLGVGLLVTIPVTLTAKAYIYNRITSHQG